ncbi:MAG: penicillin acylase family protein [Anaerolineae bacterium]|nr:penicillin acylase family protein [Anaerolineae bacterium]
MRHSRTLVIAAALTAATALLRYLYRRPLPKTDGVEAAHGLDHPVEIIRDRWGVPHIYALNQHDLLFAQGYVHAQDRLWQMEFSRRLAHGRLAEIVGPPAFEADRLFRTLGLTRAAQRDLRLTDSDTLDALQAYADGVNCWLRHHTSALPLEFQLLRTAPEPWQPLDTLAWGRMQAWILSHNWEQEVLNAALISHLGPECAARLRGDYPADNPLVLPDQTGADLAAQLLEEFDRARAWLPALRYQGLSNNWVVDGHKSATGMPLLANDPHLGLDIPAVWYENHLSAPDLEVTGVTFPGVPGVVIGHNDRIAWGVTASLPDTQDLYLERFHPDDSTLYRTGDTWEQATIHHEYIRVRGEAAPRLLEVTKTRHGPVVTSVLPLDSESSRVALSLRWTGHEPSHLSRSVLALNRARNWDEFTQALRDFDCPSQNFVYADVEGNIGLYVPGKVPLRPGRLGLVPVPGWEDENEWQGWIPFEELPHALNPKTHYVVSANNKVAGLEYPHCFSCEQYDGFRARRIADLLLEKDRLSADDFARIQNDVHSLPAQTFRRLLTSLAPTLLEHPALQDNRPRAARVLTLLREWNCELTPDSVPATVHKLVEHFAAERVFRPWLGDLTERYLGLSLGPLFHYSGLQVDNSRQVLRCLLEEDEREWFRDRDGNPLSREDILAGALNDTLAYLTHHHGEDLTRWRWGDLHRLRFHHALGQRRPLSRLLDRGPYPVGGDQTTVNASFYLPRLPLNDYSAGPSWRMIVDLSDWDSSRAILPTGQSGHPASPHYDDMISLWREGHYHPMLWSRDKVEANAEGRLVLRG